MSLRKAADLAGCTQATHSKRERALASIPDDYVAALAAACKVPVDRLYAPGEAEAALTLLEASGAVLEERLDDFEEYGGAIAAFQVLTRQGRFLQRIAIMCAPLVGGKQVHLLLDRLERQRDLHHVVFLSEEPHDRSAEAAVRTFRGAPRLHLMTLRQLEQDLAPLDRLARVGVELGKALPACRLEPHAVSPHGLFPRRRVGAALLRWARDLDGPCHLLLAGGPGSGKSTAVRALVAALSRDYLESGGHLRCPVYLPLGDMVERVDVWQWTLGELRNRLGLSSTHQVELALTNGRFIFVLDGLEEVVGHAPERLYAVERSIELLMRSPCRVLLTARAPLLFTHEPLGPPEDRLPVRVLHLEPLDREDVEAYLSRLEPGLQRDLWARIREHRMEELARHPYILDILHRGADLYRKKFIDGRAVLYELLDRTYHLWADADARSFRISLAATRGLLGYLAAELKLRGRARGRADELPPALAQVLFPETSPDGYGHPAVAGSRFLDLQDRTFSFRHGVQEDFWFNTWVVEQILAGRAAALRHLWLGPHDLTLLCGMLRDRRVVDQLLAWVMQDDRELDLRELFAYLLAFAGDVERGLAALQQLLDASVPVSLRENAAFSAVVLGDQQELQRCLDGALAADPSEERTRRRTQLIVLAIHAQFLPSQVSERILAALRALDPQALAREQEAVARDEGASVTHRAASITALARVGGPQARPLLMEFIDAFVAQGELGRPRDMLRLAMAARRALGELSRPRLLSELCTDAAPGDGTGTDRKES